jgi:glycosyltransferase involved in cell wall biosynthesis
MTTKPLVSVVIPAFNESAVIEKGLLAIKKQSYSNIEIIVIDDSSTDSTPRLARKYTDKIFIRPHAERSIQRNFGAYQSRGKYLLFLDADMELSDNVVSECVHLSSKDQSVGAIYLPEKSVGEKYWERVKAFERSFYEDQTNHWVESARFFSKDAFSTAGGYDEKITGPEDWDLSETIRKLGFTTARCTSLTYHHERISSLGKIASKWYYYGLKSYRSLERQGGLISPKTVYFLRPEFYQQWEKLLLHPLLSLSMLIMLSVQFISGGLGFLVGKIKGL